MYERLLKLIAAYTTAMDQGHEPDRAWTIAVLDEGLKCEDLESLALLRESIELVIRLEAHAMDEAR